MNGMIPYRQQMEMGFKLREEKLSVKQLSVEKPSVEEPLDFLQESERIDKIIEHVNVDEKNQENCADLLLMVAVSSDMDLHFYGDVEDWRQKIMRRIDNIAKLYVEQQNSTHGYSGNDPIPPHIIFGEINLDN